MRRHTVKLFVVSWLLLVVAVACEQATITSTPSPAPELVSAGERLAESVAQAVADEPILIPRSDQIDASLVQTLLPPDSIVAIDDPQYETAVVANDHLRPDERVIGIVINGEARAYPIPILSVHEIVNDTIGGKNVAVTWCPLCFSAIVFSRDVAEQDAPLTFGVSGKLLQNTLVMFDRETETLWSQLYGASLEGSLTPATLAFFPSVLTEWQLWYEEHPNSMVLSKQLTCAQFSCGNYADNPRQSYAVDGYASYYNLPDEGVVDRQIPRDEGSVEAKKRVLGVRVGQVARAYPYEVLRERSLFNDTLNDVPILIWFDGASETGVAFQRLVDDRTLSFALDEGDSTLLVDAETGSQWQATTGTAVAGPLQGQRLPSLFATTAFEFGWYGYFPQSEVAALEEIAK